MDGFDIIDPRFRACVLPNAPLEKLADGFRWLEGPVWFGDADCLLFSDLPNDRVLRWTESGGVSVYRQPSGFANGHTRDRQGRLISCSHQHRCITRTEWDGSVTVLGERYAGQRLNSPNDVVVKRDGTIWFTDPPYGIQTDYEGGKQIAERPACVYRLNPATGELRVVSEAFEGPNGLCFSPDERRLYVSESGAQFAEQPVQHISVMTMSDDGEHCGAPVLFHKIAPGFADGFRCDEAGRIWSSAADGVHCIAPDGALLGKIKVPFTVSNLAFGGRNRSRLFICASHTLYAIYLNCRGLPFP
ncbi:SMP-30/gluconolactonase/LRE family protein [Robbsia sp. Bb-Pol-6]|uniref:SMP-30/gluconolactonase/LRE family protein n=1 Tax=Robbsia betulipollinis TaxID=2981849 RepID=A0ABT3ZLG6_9BURK|nr:SMP-30/gluconolactonase/LRE family protein [Robbsia betulipollinis]MCY0386795.1 SMP-30/gluconolactonase/LRE family protein [Robbsia betulipollinis]